MSVVFDSSAILAFIKAEPGAEAVADRLHSGRISAVNLTGVISHLVERGANQESIEASVRGLGLVVIAFDQPQALAAGLLRRVTKAAGLSLGDRACLALAASLDVPAVTADRAWATVDAGVTVEVIR